MQNTQVKLVKRPIGEPTNDCWKIDESELPQLNDGEVLVKTLYLSIDPAMRGWMNASRSYIKPVEIGDVMRALGVGEVIDSKDDNFKKGDFISGNTGVQEYAALPAKELVKVDPSFVDLPVYLGTLGMSGMTAYFGILNTGQPKEGETVVVPRTNVGLQEDPGISLAEVPGGTSLSEVIAGLNALGVAPRDMIDILKSIKAAGALHAEFVVH